MSVTVKPKPAEGEQDFPSLALVNTRLLLPGGAEADLLEGEDAARLRELREAIRVLFEAYETATAPPPGALAAVNEAAATGPLVTQLTWDDSGPRETSYRTANGSQAALAADAIALLAGPAAARLHAIATIPAFKRHAMASSSMMRMGCGDATTRRHRPGSISCISQCGFSARTRPISAEEYDDPIGFVGCPISGSDSFTSTCVMTVATPRRIFSR